jgi:glycosyltransferase involved in cell wall biosynthesis
VAVLAPPWFPVPPPGYGGIEQVVALLADGLAAVGHDVTLFASGDSAVKQARLASVFARAPTEHIGETYWDIRHVLGCLERAHEFDLVNDHSGMLAAAIGGALETPLVHTVHGPVGGEPGRMYEQICALAPRLRLISISNSQRRPMPHLPWIASCPNAIDLALYRLEPSRRRGDYLLFVGRMTADKGAHRAIAVAREVGAPLKLAGKCREAAEVEYFDRYVRPQLDSTVEYVGEVPHAAKIDLFQRARATLFPIDWEEPFGLVPAESMACGTPVVATNRGAVPEVVLDGTSGVIVDDHHEMARALERTDRLDPAAIRRYAEQRFAPARMVADYVGAFREALGR